MTPIIPADSLFIAPKAGSHNRKHAAEQGFTLIELIVALAVASITLVAGFSALGIVQERGLAAEDVNRTALSGATQRALLVDWLSAARYQSTTGTTFTGLDGQSIGITSDELLFPTSARTSVNELTTSVRLYVDLDPETSYTGLVAELSALGLEAEPRVESLVPSVGAMDIRFLPAEDGTGEWIDGWLGRTELPRGVEIVLHAAPNETLPLLLQLPIRAALPFGR